MNTNRNDAAKTTSKIYIPLLVQPRPETTSRRQPRGVDSKQSTNIFAAARQVSWTTRLPQGLLDWTGRARDDGDRITPAAFDYDVESSAADDSNRNASDSSSARSQQRRRTRRSSSSSRDSSSHDETVDRDEKKRRQTKFINFCSIVFLILAII